jgi:NADPH2:quinone reductase
MKAVQYQQFGGPEVLDYVDLPDPRPGPGEVLIETSAIGVNFPDIRERLGVYNKAETRVGGVQLPQVGSLSQGPSSAPARTPARSWPVSALSP